MSQRFIGVFIILFSVSIYGSIDHQPTVFIKGTKLLGVLHDNNEVEMFLGLPFAAPPVDDLRWEKPIAWIPDSKKEIIEEIEEDFKNAVRGIVRLPKNSKFAVYIAYRYYFKLLKKLKKISSENIVKKRVRIHNLQKFIVIARSYIKYQLNLIQWI